jgi:hypothetical protein
MRSSVGEEAAAIRSGQTFADLKTFGTNLPHRTAGGIRVSGYWLNRELDQGLILQFESLLKPQHSR